MGGMGHLEIGVEDEPGEDCSHDELAEIGCRRLEPALLLEVERGEQGEGAHQGQTEHGVESGNMARITPAVIATITEAD